MLMARITAWAWLTLAMGCGGRDGPASALQSSLEAHTPALVDHINGPISAYDADKSLVSKLCGDAARAQAQAWGQEFDGGGLVCGETGPLILCTTIDSVHQRQLTVVFDDASTRLLGLARAPLGSMAAIQTWIAMLSSLPPTCR
jgi:hypothetical protein